MPRWLTTGDNTETGVVVGGDIRVESITEEGVEVDSEGMNENESEEGDVGGGGSGGWVVTKKEEMRV